MTSEPRECQHEHFGYDGAEPSCEKCGLRVNKYVADLRAENERLKREHVKDLEMLHREPARLRAELAAANERIKDLEAEAGMHKAFEPNGCPVCYDKGFRAALDAGGEQ